MDNTVGIMMMINKNIDSQSEYTQPEKFEHLKQKTTKQQLTRIINITL